MINDETRRKLRELNLGEIIAALEFQQNDVNTVTLSFDERFQRITDYLYQEKFNKKVQRLIKLSRFRLPKAEVADIYYSDRGLNRDALQELSMCHFLHRNMDIIFQGFTGSGKTYLACALGKQACKNQIRTRYIRLQDLLMELDESRLTGKTNNKILKKYCAFGLLIIDEWLHDDLSEEEEHFLFELIERRHDCASTVFCTQYMRKDWHTRLGGGIHADAIMDRIVHNAVWLESGTMNMRAYFAKLGL